jgi:acetyl-CoA C-acetyltransferase
MVQITPNLSRPVYIVDGSRTPFLKVTGAPGPFSASDLAVATGEALLMRQPFPASALSEVIIGCVIPSINEANIARMISLRLGCGKNVPAWTVQRNCASGLQAIDCGALDISIGRSELVLAGGTEAMSRAPIIWPESFAKWFANWARARSMTEKLKVLSQLRPQFFKPIVSLMNGLTDPVVGLSMGQTAENVAREFNITRSQMDEFALASHQHLLKAQQDHSLTEITPIFDFSGHAYAEDNGVRADTTLEKLGKLKPFFDPPYGDVTAGNSSQLTDGAALVLLASEDAIARYNLPVLAKVVSVAWAGLDPAYMGLGPACAISQLLRQTNMSVSDIDYWEINEAFAAQVLGSVSALDDPEYCKDELDRSSVLGKIPLDRLNIDGGAIACGHPLGATGARLTLHLAHVLKNKNAKYGVASMCIGGGQGGAILIEKI